MRLLIATDGSSGAGDALQTLLHLPLPSDTAISIVSVMPASYDQLSGSPRGEMLRQAETVVADARRQLAQRWPGVTGRVLEGDLRDVIVNAAATENADLVLVGARGLGALASALLGSLSLTLARLAPCPVLVAKGAPRPLRSVTIALDGSEHATAGLRFFGELPLSPSPEVHLVSVVEPLRYPTTAPAIITSQLMAAIQDHEAECRRQLDQVLATAAQQLRSRFGEVSMTTLVGRPGPTIVAEAEKHGSDLIVVGARGLGVVKRVLLGSVSEHVLRHAACPVLVVRQRGA